MQYTERRGKRMTPQSPDPFDQLRAADPVHGAPAPSESKARVWARIQEVTMATPTKADERRQNWTLGFGVAAIAAFFLWALVARGPSLAPSQDPVGGGAAGGGAAGMCLASASTSWQCATSRSTAPSPRSTATR